MSDLILKQLLKEYEKKRFIANSNFEYKKSSLYKEHPELEEINSKLNNYAILLSKVILENNDEKAKKLKKDFEKLKTEKDNLLKALNLSEDYITQK